MSEHDGPNVVTDGLVFLIDATNHKSGQSSSVWNDLIGKRNASGFVNVTYVADGGASYFDFQSSNSKITYDDNAPTTQIFDGGGSVEGWVYAESAGGSNLGRWCNKRNTSEQDGWIAHLGAGSDGNHFDARLFYLFTGTDGQWHADDALTINTWHHIVITYDADSTSNNPLVYIDGVSLSVTTVATPTGTREDDVNADVVIGNADNDIRAWDGRIGLVALHNRILTAAEVQQNFNALRGRFGK